ncbi:MAG: septum formation initiator family protein [Coriobacteriia bacterium]|nr:septum formation initiator family protein [Coriobacteriia bacterium]
MARVNRQPNTARPSARQGASGSAPVRASAARSAPVRAPAAKRSSSAKTSTQQTQKAKSSKQTARPAKEKAAPPPQYRSIKALIVIAGLLFCLVFAFLTLQPVLREYYVASRAHDLQMAEYAAVLDRNEKIESQIASLETPEGIEDRAREQFGWVRKGEEVVNITGLELSDSSTVLPAAIAPGSVAAESNWWTNLLDYLFDVDTSKQASEQHDPFVR